MVRLQPGRLVGDEAVAVGVGLVKGVVGERLDDVEQLRAERLVVALLDTAGDELLALGGDQHPVLLAAGLAEVVRLLERVAGKALGDPHHRLLVEHQAVGVAEDRLHLRMQVGDRLTAVFQVRVVAVHVGRHRTRPVEGHERGDVVEARRRERAQRRAHGCALELEHSDRVPPPQHLEGRLDQVEGDLDDRQVPQPEKVHFQKPELFDTVHLVLGDDGGVSGIGARFGLALHRQVLGERLVGDHDRGGMDAVLAPQALEAPGDVDDELRVGVLLVHLAKVGSGHIAVLVTLHALKARPEGGVAAHDERGHCLRDPVAEGVGQPEDTGTVADRGTGLDRREGDDLSDMVGAVAIGDIADHLAPAALVEVHVYVGHLLAARVQEALEEKVVADRIEVHDPQAVGDTAARGRATPRPDPDPRLPRIADDVPHDEEIGGESHISDDPQLEIEPLGHLRGDLGAVTGGGSLIGQMRKI